MKEQEKGCGSLWQNSSSMEKMSGLDLKGCFHLGPSKIELGENLGWAME